MLEKRIAIGMVLAVCVLAVSSALATTYYVSPDGNDSADGLSWETAFETIQNGIDYSANGDVVEVNEGAYYESVNLNGKDITVQSANPNDWDIVESTVIDGNGAASTIDSGTLAYSTLRGFTITGGVNGIYCKNGSNMNISRCIIEYNTDIGVKISGCGPIVQNCIIRDNSDEGICISGGGLTITNSLIYGNDDGVAFSNGGATIRNCTIVNNTSYGAVLAGGSGGASISNCILWNDGNDLDGCTAAYSCIEDGDEGTGNIDSDPCFVNADINDFHIGLISPCVDVGDTSGDYSGQKDIDGEERVMWGRIDMGADEFREYSLFGMEVESATGDSNEVTVATTGATYVLTSTGMDMYRYIDPNTNDYDDSNGGKGRKVAQLVFESDIGPLSVEVNQANIVVVESTKATFKFFSDSLFFIKAQEAFDYNHINLIADVPWNAPLDPNQRGLDRMWTDGYGGSLHAVMSEATAPAIGPNGVDYTTFYMSAGNIMAHMVYPPKRFDFDGLYGQNAKPFVSTIYSKIILDGLLNGTYDINDYIDDGFGVFLLWNNMCTWAHKTYGEPILLESGVMGYEVNEPWDPCVRDFVNFAHSKDCKVIAYLSFPSGPRWNYPQGPLAGQHQHYTVTLAWMKEFQEDYGFDGWFFDNSDAGCVADDYDFMRQARSDVGEDGIIYHHDSVDTWDVDSEEWIQRYSGLKAIFIDAYVNYAETGETGPIAEVDEPNDPYFRFFTSGYGLSQAYGAQKVLTNGKAAMSKKERWRLLGENLHCLRRNRYSDWLDYFKPAYDVQKEQYLKYVSNEPNDFVVDVNWPIDSVTGWFRYPTDVNFCFFGPDAVITWTTDSNADSEVAYTNNEVWWSPNGPNGIEYDSSKTTEHTITLTNLDPCTPYEFRIRSSNGAQEVNEIIWGYVGSFTSPPLTPNHNWKLDEETGTTVYDSIDDDDGTFNGNDPNWVDGLIGGAVDLNGVSDYFYVESLDGAYTFMDTFSVAGWFNMSQETGIQTIVGQWNQYKPNEYAPDLYFGWQVLVENDKVVARFGNAYPNAVFDITGTKDVNDGWHHFALVYPTYNENAVLYVDGEQDGTPGNKTFYLYNNKFRIGDGSYVYSGEPVLKGGLFCGMIDDVMIFERALSAEEVEQLFESGQ